MDPATTKWDQNANRIPEVLSLLEIYELLKTIYLQNMTSIPSSYQWENESHRTQELFFCLLHEMSDNEGLLDREMIEGMSRIGLFDIKRMANSQIVGRKDATGLAGAFVETMIENGFDKEQATRCTESLFRLAKVIEEKYNGKMQIFLRKYALMMLDELEREIYSEVRVDKSKLRNAITLWLQNTLEMPILLDDNVTKTFCSSKNITKDKLIEAADRLDLNLAVVDDLLTAYFEGPLEEKLEKSRTNKK
jgi:hypothetical protein